MQINGIKKKYTWWFSILVSIALIVTTCMPTSPAFAEPDDPDDGQPTRGTTATQIDDEPDDLQKKIEQTAQEYNEALDALEELEQQIEENDIKISILEGELPIQEGKSNDAIKAMYMMQQDGHSLLDMVLSAESLDSFLTNIEYINRIQKSNFEEVSRLNELKEELEETKTTLDEQRIQAEEEAERAEEALEAAKKARAEAVERARRLAEEEAKARLEAEAKAKAEAAEAEKEKAKTENGDIDWAADKQIFVAEWAPRIDAYLSGSPLAGQGKTFAVAAWNHGVDPRWSPAISCTESSKGRHCFRSHNAWGWGHEGWSSWEEAIDAHVAGLSRGYGYTISVKSAKKYCPPNWEHWYNSTLSEMNKI